VPTIIFVKAFFPLAIWLAFSAVGIATPSNKAALERHYEHFLGRELNRCTTCHLPSDNKEPQSLDDFPHNPFGDRLRALGEEWKRSGKSRDVAARLAGVADEDADGDGVANEAELFAGSNPGDATQMPAAAQLTEAAAKRAEFAKLLASYRWQPFERVARPAMPQVKNVDWMRTPIDAFLAAEHEQRGLKPRPDASKSVLLRRVYLDLIGLSPTIEEQHAFAADHSSDAYEKVVDRLLADPRYGERWGRHWMDVWRYSDWAGWTDGKQVRDSQRHIWRWRDWIVESLNGDKGYDRMILEMLAGDELAPNDPDTLRATGFLVRNYKMLSREQWLEDTVKHTAQAFLGVTLGCAKCHDHRSDPISQPEYYQVRAVFEPHQVRTDRIPGELNIEKNGLVRVYDVAEPPPTYFFIRGDERRPDKDRALSPQLPAALCGSKLSPTLAISAVSLPSEASSPDKRDFVLRDLVAASEQAVAQARAAQGDATSSINLAIAESRHAALLAELAAERLADDGRKESDDWKKSATEVAALQRKVASLEAELALNNAHSAFAEAERKLDDAARLDSQDEASADLAAAQAKGAALDKAAAEYEAPRKKLAEAQAAFAKADEQAKAEPTTSYKTRAMAEYPKASTGRRLAFARWIANPDNPLTARVAANHLWLRHFGRGIVATPENLGYGGARPSNPALLDWLASELIEQGWKMKPLHRLIVTSAAYRMASTTDNADDRLDPDNIYLWRMPSRRMEAELVRDNILYVSCGLDLTMGGPDIDHNEGLTSKRRSIYLRIAAEKEVEFLKLFDGPSVNECYQRRSSVLPQQALALANSELPLAQARLLAKRLHETAGEDAEAFVRLAFRQILAREASADEIRACLAFLVSTQVRPRENFIAVLFNHTDFVTIR
jgi:hypothetical protein